MIKRRKNIIIALLPLALIPLIFAAAALYSRIRGLILPCPILSFLHIYCPGCGGTRAVYAVLEGDFIRALRCNALYFGVFVICILYWHENVFAAFGIDVKIIPRSRLFLITASGIAIAYIILRNFIPFLAPIA